MKSIDENYINYVKNLLKEYYEVIKNYYNNYSLLNFKYKDYDDFLKQTKNKK